MNFLKLSSYYCAFTHHTESPKQRGPYAGRDLIVEEIRTGK